MAAMVTRIPLTLSLWCLMAQAHAISQPGGARCSPRELEILEQYDALETKVTGKVRSGLTLKAVEQPGSCESAAGTELCFKAWGFSAAAAGCWAQEVRNRALDCLEACGMYAGGDWLKDTMVCRSCRAKVVLKRKACALKVLGVSGTCKACQLDAHTYYSNTCAAPCASALSEGTGYASAKCRKCNDLTYAMLSLCGAEPA
eukprot:CAMPEP_0179297734 /NCGR_PEP_ID=MMETSP0797-20121207/45622_1 /TAXON_ID=47934 /ORGANISM="Dinophysis acuminata, Strain DAEP01" /LENGTH=200 /DNA_ID=CAMNT_0021007083 /DNA_START=28 /DNA_END=626 /DNA_ORIENTATION=-